MLEVNAKKSFCFHRWGQVFNPKFVRWSITDSQNHGGWKGALKIV